MADETTKELSGDDLLRVLLQRVDQMFVQQQRLYDQQQQLFAQQQEMNARLIKVEAFVDERVYDTRPKLDLIYKEIADVRTNDLPAIRQEIADLKQNELAVLQQRVDEISVEGRRHGRLLKALHDDIMNERIERVELDERVELLERKAA
ncbi:MAG: hypothetical protein HOP19_04630 [Acidobacteria bacterium]|nr:hypothetical protein [Acidobacteriota bacterium]